MLLEALLFVGRLRELTLVSMTKMWKRETNINLVMCHALHRYVVKPGLPTCGRRYYFYFTVGETEALVRLQ